MISSSLYDHFFTGSSLKDQRTRELLLLLIDLGSSLEMEEAETLLDNLYEFCGFFVNWESNIGKSREELLGSAEVEWLTRLQMIFHNATIAQNNQQMPPLVKEVLARFNSQHEFKVNKFLSYFCQWGIMLSQ